MSSNVKHDDRIASFNDMKQFLVGAINLFLSFGSLSLLEGFSALWNLSTFSHSQSNYDKCSFSLGRFYNESYSL